ncbi:long-chain acyl-CoA synthetase [Metabacillus crassostreae]|uniref:AMP-binding protein n=1 Tax=Metabacillus crassostreae TaxID=929098 RepID=UPI00195E54F5|nr:AMP-binding protein [Metabacillus crassostreae]MBM7605694.1 long-chain acyl-CoA synthetase [Metabacillus crassostreae]
MEVQKPWLTLYPEEIPHELLLDDGKSLHDYLKQSALEFPTKTAIHFLGKELSYSEVYNQSLKLANYFQSLGLQKDERVSIMLPNCPQAVIAYYGVLLAGGIVVQTNPLYMERELEYQLKDSESTFIITLDLLYPRVSKMKALTNIKHIIVTSIKDYLPFPKNLLYPMVQKKQNQLVVKVEHEGTTHQFKKIMEIAQPDIEIKDCDPINDIALLQYTGGTTGFPKGVMLTHHNVASNTKMCSTWMYKCKRGEESILGIIPFFHVYGMTTVMNLSVMQGYKMILLPKFDAKDALKTIGKLKPTLFPGAPTIYIALLNHPDIQKYDLSSIKCCISGSAPLPVEVQEKFEQVTGGRLVEGYGLSETSPVTHANFIWGERKKGSIGVPWPNTEAIVYSYERDGLAEPNELGEIAIRGPQVMKGYWNKKEETEATFKDGWLLTGDIGYMDEAGYFYIVDRKKDMILAGGYNIYPREIEEVLYEHEKVQEVVVAGVPDPYRGETVKAYIVLKDGHDATTEEFNEYARKHLAAYKVPRIYEFRDELPKTAVGKILRRALVDEEKEKMKNAN